MVFTQKPISYNSIWPLQFEKESTRIREIFGSALINLHHVGSTAVPGLLSKPILDMVGEYLDREQIEIHVNQMENNGFEYKGEFGISDRAFFSRSEEIAVHLHLFPKGHFQIEKHILFRDYLISNPEAVLEYSNKKKEL